MKLHKLNNKRNERLFKKLTEGYRSAYDAGHLRSDDERRSDNKSLQRAADEYADKMYDAWMDAENGSEEAARYEREYRKHSNNANRESPLPIHMVEELEEDTEQLKELFGSSAEKMSDAVEDEENASPDPDLKRMVIDNQTSFKVFDGKPELAAKLMKELLKGGTMFKHLQQAQGDFAVKLEDLKKWVQGIGGIAVFAKRAAAIGSKIPEKGLPKSKMPFLPGPKDADQSYTAADVGDALTPGGKYNVDMMEKLHRHVTEKVDAPAPNTFVGMKSPEAQAFMTGGLNDGDPNDDVIKVKLNGKFAAADGIPTQTNILFPKALGMAMNGVAGGDLGAYASFNGEILDGHHRWAATMLNKPNATINTFALIDLDKLGVEKTLQYLTVIGNALGNKTKVK